MSRLVGLRAYSRLRRCTLSQVQKSIANGRLEKSVHRKGRRLWIDVAEADREWEANRDTSKVRDRQAAPPDRAPALLRAYDELLTLIEKIEGRLEDTFSDAFTDPARRNPKSRSARLWKALYVDWAKLVPSLEDLQHAARAAAGERRTT